MRKWLPNTSLPTRRPCEVVHEISGAIIAITLVMTAVFIPVTFMPGPVGVFYRQFGITMAMSIVLSGVVALTLTPVLCAMILKPHGHARRATRSDWSRQPSHRRRSRAATRLSARRAERAPRSGCRGRHLLRCCTTRSSTNWWPSRSTLTTSQDLSSSPAVVAVLAILTFRARCFREVNRRARRSADRSASSCIAFDRGVEKVTGVYAAIVGRIVTRRLLTMTRHRCFCYGILTVNKVLPSGFIPLEDQGMIYGIIQTPPGSTLEYTNSKTHELADDLQRVGRSHLRLFARRLRGSDRGPGLQRGNLSHQLEALVRAQADLEADHRGARRERDARLPT